MSKIKLFEEQDFNKLNEQHDSRRLFIDPRFPATLHSISHTGKLEIKNVDDENILNDIEWRRPHVSIKSSLDIYIILSNRKSSMNLILLLTGFNEKILDKDH